MGRSVHEAENLMREQGVLWSDRRDLDGLSAHVGLKPLPEIESNGEG